MGFGHRSLGELPSNGLIASNHLSYFDILFFGATVPCVFVSKSEVRQWPLLGLLAALGGTIFLDRSSAASAAEAVTKVQKLLETGVLVLVFPEGTSSDGAEVLRFHASLFEPAVRVGATVTAAAIGYSAGAGATEKDLCYYGDISFAPHLFQTLQLPAIAATLNYASPGQIYTSRKPAAAQTHEMVVELRRAIRSRFQLL
jgi:lyso-ornithine lipid O-acyltransferase